jgi:integrase
VDFKTASLHIRRAKNGTPATHPLSGREMSELRRHQRESPQSPFVFVSERGAPLSAPGFSRMVKRAATEADLGIKAHAHMLRHACGYKLANDGHDTRAIQAYLGHRNIQNTTRYTALAPQRFEEFFEIHNKELPVSAGEPSGTGSCQPASCHCCIRKPRNLEFLSERNKWLPR